jgi:hypothetical protein
MNTRAPEQNVDSVRSVSEDFRSIPATLLPKEGCTVVGARTEGPIAKCPIFAAGRTVRPPEQRACPSVAAQRRMQGRIERRLERVALEQFHGDTEQTFETFG